MNRKGGERNASSSTRSYSLGSFCRFNHSANHPSQCAAACVSFLAGSRFFSDHWMSFLVFWFFGFFWCFLGVLVSEHGFVDV